MKLDKTGKTCLIVRVWITTLEDPMPFLPALIADEVLRVRESLPEDVEVGFVGAEAEHDEVSVGTVDAVRRVGVVRWLGSLRAYEVENFVFAFTWNKGIAEQDDEVFPKRVGVHLLNDVKLERLGKPVHELGAWRDHVRVEVEAARLLLFATVQGQRVSPVCLDLLFSLGLFFSIFCCSKPSRSLLVHFGSWCDAINGKVNKLLGLNQFYDFVCVRVDVFEDFVLALRLCAILRMSTWMDNSVHVKVQVINYWIVFLDPARNGLFFLLALL